MTTNINAAKLLLTPGSELREWQLPAVEALIQRLPGIDALQERAERLKGFDALVPDYNQGATIDALLQAKTPVEATKILDGAERAYTRRNRYQAELKQVRRAHDNAVREFVTAHLSDVQRFVITEVDQIIAQVPDAYKRTIAERYGLPVPKGARVFNELVAEFDALHFASRALLGTLGRPRFDIPWLTIVRPEDIHKIALTHGGTAELLQVLASGKIRVWAPTAHELDEAGERLYNGEQRALRDGAVSR